MARNSGVNNKIILIAILVVLLGVAGVVGIIIGFSGSKAQISMELAKVLAKLVDTENLSADAELEFEISDNKMKLSTKLYALKINDSSVYAVDDGQNSVYLQEGILFLENGKAFKLAESGGNVFSALEGIGAIYQAAEIAKTQEQGKDIYSITLEAQNLQIYVTCIEKELETIEICDAQNILVRLSNFTELGQNEYEIPSKVTEAIETVNKDSLQVLGEDLYRLICAGMEFGTEERVGTVTFDVSCGLLKFDTQLPWSSKGMNSAEITNPDEIAKMPALMYELFLNGEFTYEESESTYIYRLNLDEETMQEYAKMIAPEIVTQVVNLTSGNICITIVGESIKSIEIDIDGSVYMILAEVDAAIGATFEFE